MEGGGGRRRWKDEMEPNLRLRVVERIAPKLAELFRPEDKPPPQILHKLAENFEEDLFKGAETKIDYMRRISSRIATGQKLRNMQAAADNPQQQKQMVHQMQMDNMVHANQGVKYPFTTVPQAEPMMASPSWPFFQSPNQHMTCPSASNMWLDDSQGQYHRIAMPYQTFNSLPETVAPVALGVQCGQQIMQSIYIQSQNQHPAMQLHPPNVSQLRLAGMAKQLQGQPIARPYEHRNHFLMQNVAQRHLAGMGEQLQGQTIAQPYEHQNHFLRQNVAQHHLAGMGEQLQGQPIAPSYEHQNHFLRQNVAQRHLAGMGKQLQGQPIAQPYEHQNHFLRQNVCAYGQHLQPTIHHQHFGITRQQEGMQSYQMLEANVAKMNNRDFGGWNNQQNAGWASGLQSPLKACERVTIGRQTNMESQPIPPPQRHMTVNQQSNVHCPSVKNPARTENAGEVEEVAVERQTNMESQPIPLAQRFNSTADIAQFTGEISNQQQLLPDESIGQRSQIVVSSPSVSVKSTLTSTLDLEKSGFQAAASPCASVKSASASAIAKSGNVLVASQSDSDSSFLLPNTTAANGCNQATLAKRLTPAPPRQRQTPAAQAEEQEHGGAETLVPKKVSDRPVAALLSSPPEMLPCSVNLMKSVLSDMDSVPSRIESGRVYNVTSSCEPLTLCSIDGRAMTFELDASDSTSILCHNLKRQKTQNANDALLDEIDAINSRLIDTFISVISDVRTDGIATHKGVTLVKLSYTAVSLAPGLKSHFAISGKFQRFVMPMTLLIPADYPRSSPVIVDDEGDAQLRTKFSCISVAVDRVFRLALRNIKEPRSLNETARAWDSCVRCVITEYACRLGGGTLSSSLRPV